jgi:peptide chain release factor 2
MPNYRNYQRRRKNLCSRFLEQCQRSRNHCKKLRSKKKWVEDYEKANDLTEELQITYEFYKEGELTEKN